MRRQQRLGRKGAELVVPRMANCQAPSPEHIQTFVSRASRRDFTKLKKKKAGAVPGSSGRCPLPGSPCCLLWLRNHGLAVADGVTKVFNDMKVVSPGLQRR